LKEDADMNTVKLVNILYYLGSDAKELERNSFSTSEEAILEATRVASTLKHPIPILILVNGISVRYATAFPDETVCFDTNIFANGENIINTIVALTKDFSDSNISLAKVTAKTLYDLACDCEYVTALLTEQDYSELLGEDFVNNIKSEAGNNADAAFKVIARMDSIIDNHSLPLSEIEVIDAKTLMDSYDFTVRKDIDKSNDYGLVSLYKTLGMYFNIPVQI